MTRSFLLRVLLAVAIVLGAVLPLTLWLRAEAPGLEGRVALPLGVDWRAHGFLRVDAFAAGERVFGTTCEIEDGAFSVEVVESEVGRQLHRIELRYEAPGLGALAAATLNLNVELTEAPVDLGTVQLELVQTLVSGSVHNDLGEVVEDASVSLEAFDDERGRWRAIDSVSLTGEGRFRFDWRAETRPLRIQVHSFDCEALAVELANQRELELVLTRLATVALADEVALRLHPAFEVTVVGAGPHAGRSEAFDERPLTAGTTISVDVPAGSWDVELRTRGQGATALTLGTHRVLPGARLDIDLPEDLDPWARAERVVVRVVDPSGEPVPGAQLDFGARVLGAALRSAPGRFELARVPGTPQRFTVRAEGFTAVEVADPEPDTLVRLERVD